MNGFTTEIYVAANDVASVCKLVMVSPQNNFAVEKFDAFKVAKPNEYFGRESDRNEYEAVVRGLIHLNKPTLAIVYCHSRQVCDFFTTKQTEGNAFKILPYMINRNISFHAIQAQSVLEAYGSKKKPGIEFGERIAPRAATMKEIERFSKIAALHITPETDYKTARIAVYEIISAAGAHEI